MNLPCLNMQKDDFGERMTRLGVGEWGDRETREGKIQVKQVKQVKIRITIYNGAVR